MGRKVSWPPRAWGLGEVMEEGMSRKSFREEEIVTLMTLIGCRETCI